MKRHPYSRILRGIVLCSATLSTACGEGGVTDTATLNDPLIQRVIELGFRSDMIEDRGSYFLVEGDIRLEKADLTEGGYSPRSAERDLKPSFQAVTTGLVGLSEIQSIIVDLSRLSAYPEWATAARTAMNEWSTLAGTRVRFREDSRFPAKIVVSTYSQACLPSGSCTLAVASFPGAGKPGPTIRINVGFNRGLGPNGQPTASSKVYNMVHEFGHTIGFRHTNWQQRGETAGPEGANTVPGTPTTDASSFMNGGTANNNYAGFSFYDRVAARKVYLGFGPVPSGSISNNHPSLTWPAMTEASSYNIRLVTPVFDPEFGWIDGSNVFVGSTSALSFVDGSRNATRVGVCAESSPGYYVQANFPGSITTYGWGGRICFF
jgi:hypothetical protein